MRALAPTCLLLVLLSSAAPSQAGIVDKFSDFINQVFGIFRHYEEAPYTVINKGHGYEEREYPASKWVCTPENTNSDVGQDLGHLFWPLFNFISGTNDRKEEIPMTTPVTTEFKVRGPSDKSYEMCFFLGAAHQDNPPRPQPSTGLYIKDRPEMRVLTRTVGGYLTHEENWVEEAGKLAAILQENGKTVNLSHMYWVGYDSPMKFWNRRNEIWFLTN
ncbi:heme-binding protein 2-like [Eriocheir sinensis]|uniref:heme-binding protein 2-like n=1 Tax=Eriocheir sinensis TaxID=95602 RepID=UPI0021C98144|nr:heme-binding protein 2-like [Eriocheir sinensis]